VPKIPLYFIHVDAEKEVSNMFKNKSTGTTAYNESLLP
jgi:hypothetical protein